MARTKKKTRRSWNAHTTEQKVAKLQRVELARKKGMTQLEAVRINGLSISTYRRWREELNYDEQPTRLKIVMPAKDSDELTLLRAENAKLEKRVTALTNILVESLMNTIDQDRLGNLTTLV